MVVKSLASSSVAFKGCGCRTEEKWKYSSHQSWITIAIWLIRGMTRSLDRADIWQSTSCYIYLRLKLIPLSLPSCFSAKKNFTQIKVKSEGISFHATTCVSCFVCHSKPPVLLVTRMIFHALPPKHSPNISHQFQIRICRQNTNNSPATCHWRLARLE